jgi:hypothetical protein
LLDLRLGGAYHSATPFAEESHYPQTLSAPLWIYFQGGLKAALRIGFAGWAEGSDDANMAQHVAAVFSAGDFRFHFALDYGQKNGGIAGVRWVKRYTHFDAAILASSIQLYWNLLQMRCLCNGRLEFWRIVTHSFEVAVDHGLGSVDIVNSQHVGVLLLTVAE